ncbi:HAD hydrolase-like protein [Pseudoclavibacter endophyticus]|uniref:HAD hydrolase-like protein n=1 Tax=Pseudoclavibacter endophyticus TaxID=1778590 RepID=A0A6H9WL63_9MICO|nr:HAD hydrolase-like protein [Pseudoclavibacter endophyticus]KAB1648788.1 HAD hydrolase-like protein [Pseudoclavibacter endophyticus]
MSATRPQPAATATTALVDLPRGTGRPPFTAVLWDLDGTIVDSAPGIISSIQKMLAVLGLEVPPYDDLVSYIGPPILDSFREHGLGEIVELEYALGVYRDIYREEGEANSRVYPGMADVIRAVHDAGIPMSTATSKNQESAARVLEHFGLHRSFDAVVGATPDDSRSAKADVVAEALRVLETQGHDLSNVIMLGDRFYDVEGSSQHGVPCVYVTWGYGTVGEEAGSVAVVDDPARLPGLLGLEPA